MNHSHQGLERALREKFLLISISVVFVVLLVISVAVNLFNYLQVTSKAETLIAYIAENDGTLPLPTNEEPPLPMDLPGVPTDSDLPPHDNPPQENPLQDIPSQENPSQENPPQENLQPQRPSQGGHLEIFAPPSADMNEESLFTTRFFAVKFNQQGEVTWLNTSNVQRINPMQAMDMAGQAYHNTLHSSMYSSFYFEIFPLDQGETMVIFVDVSEDLFFFQSFLYSSSAICLLAMVGVVVLLILMSKKVVAPIVESYARQKEFITDMSHELKTPLAIVKANTEVMELDHGSSAWTESNHKQIEKLNLLVVRLLSLAKLEEDVLQGEAQEFSLSDVVQEAGEGVEILLALEEKDIVYDIRPEVSFYGDPVALRQVLDILLENAVKYSMPGTNLALSLHKEKHYLVIRVKNQVKNLKKGNYDQWFQRFYREETSRNSETGGFGLGLSLAKTLVKHHHGKISANCEDGKTVEIKVELRRKNPEQHRGNL